MRSINELYPQLFSQSQAKIVIVPHAKPDADALGASVAWALFLRKFGHDVSILSPTNWAEFLQFLTELTMVIDMTSDYSKGHQILNQADYFFAIDWNSWGRILFMEKLCINLQAKKILLDHHCNADIESFDYGLSLPEHSSSSEIILDQILQIRPEFLDSSIATAIYAGIIGDTGSFRFSSTSPELHEKVAILLRQNISHSQIHQYLFDTNTPLKLEFLGHMLSNRLQIRFDGRVALMWVTQEDIVNYAIKTGDTEGLITNLMSLKDVMIGALITDRINEIRLSLRSKVDDFDMSYWASKYFQGGGHKMAAGGMSNKKLEEVIQDFWNSVETELNL